MTAASTEKPNRLNEALWYRFPVTVRRTFPGLSMILTDGLYVSAWPQAGGAAPLLALFVGIFTGALFLVPNPYSVPIYGSSLLLMGVLIAVSSFGAALGLWIFLGYVLGDLFVFRLLRVLGTEAQIGKHGWADMGYLAVLYGLLGVLLVSVPFVSHRLRRLALFLPVELWNLMLASFGRRGRKIPNFLTSFEGAIRNSKAGHKKWLRFPFDAALYASFTGLLVYLWTQCTPILLRSATVWYVYPDVQSASVGISLIQPLQNDYPVLIKVGAVCGVIRIALEYVASGRSGFLKNVASLSVRMRGVTPRQNGVLAWAGEAARILLATLFLYGILEEPFNIAVTAVVLLLSAIARKVILPRVAFWVDFVTTIPLIIRISLVVVGAYFLSTAMMQNRLNGSAFYPVLLPLWVCLLLATIFFPERRHPADAASTASRREGGSTV